jgi:hypothetical protein
MCPLIWLAVPTAREYVFEVLSHIGEPPVGGVPALAYIAPAPRSLTPQLQEWI